jgi:hypothetical protein
VLVLAEQVLETGHGLGEQEILQILSCPTSGSRNCWTWHTASA